MEEGPTWRRKERIPWDTCQKQDQRHRCEVRRTHPPINKIPSENMSGFMNLGRKRGNNKNVNTKKELGHSNRSGTSVNEHSVERSVVCVLPSFHRRKRLKGLFSSWPVVPGPPNVVRPVTLSTLWTLLRPRVVNSSVFSPLFSGRGGHRFSFPISSESSSLG